MTAMKLMIDTSALAAVLLLMWTFAAPALSLT